MKSMARTSKLNKLLEKRGIKDTDELSPEEKATYDRFRYILTGESLTIESIKLFCENQLKIIESKSDGVTPLTNLQQACIHVYINLIKSIEAPEAERKSIERHLNQLIEQ